MLSYAPIIHDAVKKENIVETSEDKIKKAFELDAQKAFGKTILLWEI